MTISVDQAQLSLKELIQKIALGEVVIITQGDKPIAARRSLAGTKAVPRFGSCKGMLTVVAEDQEHLEDFAEYMK